MLPLKFASPPYTAVMGCAPTANAELVNVAIPDALTGPVLIIVDPSLNVTVPVRVPAPGATTATVAVNVTDWFKSDGFTEELRVVVVSALLMVRLAPT